MKKIISLILISMVMTSIAYAQPERLQIKSNNARAAEESAAGISKNVDLNAIEDPTARLAIKAIFERLDLPSKK